MSSPGGHSRVFVLLGCLCIGAAILGNPSVSGTVLLGGKPHAGRVRAALWLMDLLCLGLGLLFIKNRDRLRWRQLLLSVTALMVAVVAAEFALRGFFLVKNYLQPRDRNFSETLGWETAADLHADAEIPGYGLIHYSTQAFGFRVFGDPTTTKKKILVLGDSYTQAYSVSDGQAYYDYLGQHNDQIEIFAYGAGGYGSLQEYLILDRYIDLVRPDLILWQFHWNDLINNSHALESASCWNNNHMTRPYYQHGEIVLAYPGKQQWGWLYGVASSSALVRLLHVNLDKLRPQLQVTAGAESIEQSLTPDHPLVQESVAATVEIMKLARRRAGAIPFVAFSTHPDGYYAWSPADVCRQADIQFIPGVGETVEAARAAGTIVDGSPHDLHWNYTGHALAGKVILDYLTCQDLLARHERAAARIGKSEQER